MKQKFEYLINFIVSVMLGEVGFKNIINLFRDTITIENISSLIGLFSTREIASGIWIIISILAIFTMKNVRKPLLIVLKIATKKQILIPLIIILFYTISLIIIALNFKHWDWKFIKDIILWVLFIGIPLVFGAISTKDNHRYFLDFLKQNISLTIILEFLLSSVTFSLKTEFVMLPIFTVIILSQIVAYRKNEYEKAGKLLSFLVTCFSLAIILFSFIEAINTYANFNSSDLLISFLIPMVFSILFIPVAYSFAVFSEYQILFNKMNSRMPLDLSAKSKWQIIKVCKLSYRTIKKFKIIYLGKINKKMSSENFQNLIKEFKEEKNIK